MSPGDIDVVRAKSGSSLTRQNAARAAVNVSTYCPTLNSSTRFGRWCVASSSATANDCTSRASDSGPMITRAVAKVDDTVSWSVVSSPRGTGIARSSPTNSIAASR